MRSLLFGLTLLCGVVSAQVTPNSTYYLLEEYLGAINASNAWSITTGSSSVIIAVVDTGVWQGHPGLTGKMVAGFDIYDNVAIPTSGDSDVTGLGTWEAGVIAPVSTNSAISGLCWTCLLMPIRVSDANGNFTDANVASGINWAVAHGAKIVQVGFPISAASTYPLTNTAAAAAVAAGLLVVAPAGNTATVSSAPDNANIITVSGVDYYNSSAIWTLSNTGTNIDIAAPNFSNYTTVTATNLYGADNGGTSISAAIVSGIAALMWSINPTLTPAQIRSDLETTAVQKSGSQGSRNNTFGYGVVNAQAAVQAASGSSSLAKTTTTLISSANPSNLTQSVTLTASTSPSAATGTITFLNGASSLGSATLSNGTASLTITSLPGGANALTASYGGNSTYATSTSTQLTQNVITLDNESWNFVALLNNYRAQQGLSAVQVDLYLENDAQWMSASMATGNYYSTTDNLGRTTTQRATAFSYAGSVSESIANTNTTGQATITALANACDANSSGVCTYNDKNLMLNANTKAIGVAHAFNANSTYGTYWDIEYGNTLDIVVPISEIPAPTISAFTALPATISFGQPSTLSWTQEEGTTVSISNTVGNQIGNVGILNSTTVSPTSNSTYTLTSTNLNGTATASVTVTVASVSTITATNGGSQSAYTYIAFTNPLVATVKDVNSNPVPGATVTFTAPSSGANSLFANGTTVTTAVTNASGVATSSAFTADGIAGTYNIVASVPTSSGTATVNFSETNNQAPAASITATSGTPQTANTGVAFTLPLVVTVKDAGSHAVPGVTVTWTVPGSGASGTFAGSANTAVTNSMGIATSAIFTANSTAGSYSVTAAVSGVSASATFSLTNNTATIGNQFQITGCGTPLTSTSPFGGVFSATSANCTALITMGGQTAKSGWYCGVWDLTTQNDTSTWHQILPYNTTTATLAGIASVGDSIMISCSPF